MYETLSIAYKSAQGRLNQDNLNLPLIVANAHNDLLFKMIEPMGSELITSQS